MGRRMVYRFMGLEVYGFIQSWEWFISLEIYVITKAFPSDEKFGLTSQLRRAASSIGDNLAEGTGKLTAKDKAKYTTIAFGSAMETVNHLIGSLDLAYIKDEDYRSLREKLEVITRLLTRLHNSQMNGTGNGSYSSKIST